MALNYMHRKGVVHRDLKMENVMVEIEQDEDGNSIIICKLTDFGFATLLEGGAGSKQKLGTPLYMAPEIINGEVYDSKVDIWALGVLTYCLLSGGRFPFDDRTLYQLKHKIRNAQPDLSFVDRYSNADSLRNFMQQCLNKNKDERASAADLLQHEWLTGVYNHAKTELKESEM